MSCVHCGFEPLDGLLLCPRCGGEQPEPGMRSTAVPEVSAVPEVPGAPAGVAGRPAPASPASGRCPCGAEVAPADGECGYCYTPRPPDGWTVARGEVPSRPVLLTPGGRRVPLGDRPLLVGREDSPLSDDLADYDGVSRRHALVTVVGDRVLVADIGSSNGTFVNGERVNGPGPREIRPGDRIGLGLRCSLVLERSDDAPGGR